MKKIAISQSNYIPWRGYFDLINSVDEFILYDDMQYTKRDWRNRNKIKTPNGCQWLSVPVKVKGRYNQKIKDTKIDGNLWKAKHFNSIVQNYKQAAHFEQVISLLEPIYQNESFSYLSQLNHRLLTVICEFLGITTKLNWSMEYELVNGKTEKLLDLCIKCKASLYVSGPSAQDYIETDLFDDKDIKIQWFDFSGYREYQQLWGVYTPNTSVIDTLFNCGNNPAFYLSNPNSNTNKKTST